MSLHDWSIPPGALTPSSAFDNYRELLGDPRFWNALRNTADLHRA